MEKGVRPKNAEEAAKEATKYRSDRGLLRQRVAAALDELKKNPNVDEKRIAAIGYCFGVTAVLELARSGAPIAGVVTFHGGLDTPKPDDAKDIKAKVLVLHGADDPLVPAAQVAAFTEEMRKGSVDWQMIFYADAVHSFTKPAAGTDKSKGNAYNEKADKRSWEAMKSFFKKSSERRIAATIGSVNDDPRSDQILFRPRRQMMKKLFVLAPLVLLCAATLGSYSSQAQQQEASGIEWLTDMKTALQRAKRRISRYCLTSSIPIDLVARKWMQLRIPTKRLSNSYNSHMIAVRVRHDQRPLAEDFKGKWTPTLITLDAEGTERQRTVGFCRPRSWCPR